MSPLLFETIQVIDGIPQRLAYHQRRAELSCASILPPLEEVIPSLPPGEWRIHIPYHSGGWIREGIRTDLYQPRKIRSLKIVETSLEYSLKREDRSCFEAIKKQHPEADELILTREGRITDTTFSNLVFGAPGHWITPDTYLLRGTRREALLRNGEITAAPLRTQDLPSFPYASLINAMLPPGRVMLPINAIVNLETLL